MATALHRLARLGRVGTGHPAVTALVQGLDLEKMEDLGATGKQRGCGRKERERGSELYPK